MEFISGSEDILFDNFCLYTYNEIIIEDTSVAIVNITPQINLYPNPTSEILFLEINNTDLSGNAIHVYTMSGQQVGLSRIVETNILTQLDVSELNNGLYFICIDTENGKYFQPFSIVR